MIWYRNRTVIFIVCLDLAEKWRPMYWAEERGQIIGGIGPFLSKRQRERKVYFSRSSDDRPPKFTSTSDKATRARSIQARMRMGMVYLPKGAPWTEALTGELLRFTGEGRDEVDDQVDVLSLIGRMLDDMRQGVKPSRKEPPRGVTIDDLDRRRRLRRHGIRSRDAYYVM